MQIQKSRYIILNIILTIELVLCKNYDRVNDLIDKLNRKYNKSYTIYHKQNEFNISLTDYYIRFEPINKTEILNESQYKISFPNSQVEIFYNYEIKPIYEDPYLNKFITITNKKGYALINIENINFTQQNDYSYRYKQIIKNINNTFDELNEFEYFNFFLNNSILNKFTDIWNEHVKYILNTYPKPKILQFFENIVQCLTNLKKLYSFKFYPDVKGPIEIFEISYDYYERYSEFIGIFYKLKFIISYNDQIKKEVLFSSAKLTYEFIAFKNMIIGNTLEKKICEELMKDGIEMVLGYDEVIY